jgi:4-amino-4-deoxychorismate lyase
VNTWINGRRGGSLDPGDRGLHYGDGLFETMRVHQSEIRLLELHLERLYAGCKHLKIAAPAPRQLRAELRRIAAGGHEAILKLIVTRGVTLKGGRPGYRPSGKERATRIVSLHALAPAALGAEASTPVRVRLCRTPAGISPAQAGLKTLNRLESVIARSEWTDPRIWDGLMADTEGHWVCGTMSNLFLRQGTQLWTPPLDRSGVAGVMRRWVMQAAPRLQLRARQRRVRWTDLTAADEVFLTNAVVGIKSVGSIAGGAAPLHFTEFDAAQRLRGLLEAL